MATVGHAFDVAKMVVQDARASIWALEFTPVLRGDCELGKSIDRIARVHQLRDCLILIGSLHLRTLGIFAQVPPNHILAGNEPASRS